MDMPDMPVNVPIDDPNADTEWFVYKTPHPSGRVCVSLVLTVKGTTSFANMELYPRNRHHPRL